MKSMSSLFRYWPPPASLKVWPLIRPWTSSFQKGSLKDRKRINEHKHMCTCTDKTDKALCTVPVSNETLILAEVTEEASIVQVHDSVLLSSDVHVHRQPVIR